MTVVSLHKDRVVREEGDRFVKEFASKKDRDAEVERLDWLKRADVAVPEIVELSGTSFVTARLPGKPLDELIAGRWMSMYRGEKNALIKRVAALCRITVDAITADHELDRLSRRGADTVGIGKNFCHFIKSS